MEAINWKRNTKNMEYYGGDLETCYDPDKQQEIDALSSTIRDSIKKIKNKDHQDTLILFYFAGFKILEIAEILNTTEQNIKNWLNRGRRDLKSELEKNPEFVYVHK